MRTPGASLPTPPFFPYGTLHGTLFQYSSYPSLVAFESCPPAAVASSSSPPSADTTTPLPRNKCILIGGLSDGLLPVPYTKNLETACHELGWSLVQPIISSSYLGFGHGSLKRDTDELSALMRYLHHHRYAENFAIVGHSTGCQNSIHFLKHGDADMIAKTKSVAMQAPVSDREGAMLEPKYEENIHIARQMKEDRRAHEMMPRSAFWAPITASRFLSLQDIGGDDDFFSSDLSDEEMASKLGHVFQWGIDNAAYMLAAYSGADEYVPKHVDKDLLLERMCRAMNGSDGKARGDGCTVKRPVATPLMIETGNHNLSEGNGDGARFVAAVAEQLDIAVPSSYSTT